MPGPPSFAGIRRVLESNDFALTRPYRQRREPFDHVTAAREQGPSIVQSFHERMTRQGGRLHAVLSDVVAFANTNGGTVYLGVSARSGPPVGVEDVPGTIAALQAEFDSKIVPPIEAQIDSLESQGRQVVRVRVPEGTDKPYCLDGTRIYLRNEGETGLAVRDEIKQLIRRVLLESGELAEAPPAKSKSKRRGKRSEAAAKSEAKSEPPLAPDSIQPEPVGDSGITPPAGGGIRPPTVGVQIVNVVERGGKRYYAIRDLRNGNTVQNVTLNSARRLWRYAITQYEDNPPQADKIGWQEDVGLLKAEKRAGKRRYDFVQRFPDGQLAVYYGVTEEGCEEPWRQFMVGEDSNDS
jgi:hypothetical protein